MGLDRMVLEITGDVKVIPPRSLDDLRAAGYDGPLVMGLDRMVLEITGDVKVVPPRSLDDLPNLDSKGQKFP